MNAPVDAPDVWTDALLPGGYVCGTCLQPTESEPCRKHQPRRFFAVYGNPEDVAEAIGRFVLLVTGKPFRTDADEVERFFFPLIAGSPS